MERCRHCGKPIEPFFVIDRWTHKDGGLYRKYCHAIIENPSTWDINKFAEPFTKNEIVYEILKDL